jgi:mannose-6-phosphate isomerase-like protein (cupin superfamily)
MARWTVRELSAVPKVTDGEPGDPRWYPIQHALGIDTFGVNVFVATRTDQTLVEAHDERESGQQELYLVLEGVALFELDGEQVQVGQWTAVAVPDPSVRRSARALAPGTTLLAVGASGPFASTWHSSHFSDIPRPE